LRQFCWYDHDKRQEVEEAVVGAGDYLRIRYPGQKGLTNLLEGMYRITDKGEIFQDNLR